MGAGEWIALCTLVLAILVAGGGIYFGVTVQINKLNINVAVLDEKVSRHDKTLNKMDSFLDGLGRRRKPNLPKEKDSDEAGESANTQW